TFKTQTLSSCLRLEVVAAPQQLLRLLCSLAIEVDHPLDMSSLAPESLEFRLQVRRRVLLEPLLQTSHLLVQPTVPILVVGECDETVVAHANEIALAPRKLSPLLLCRIPLVRPVLRHGVSPPRPI